MPVPDWQLTPEEEVYGDKAIDANGMAPMVDENGMPIATPPPRSRAIRSNNRWSARTAPAIPRSRNSTRRSRRNSSRARYRRSPASPQPPLQSTPPPDPSQPRPQAP